MKNFKPLDTFLTIADGRRKEIKGVGEVSFISELTVGGKKLRRTFTLRNVHWAPGIVANLISTAELNRKGLGSNMGPGLTTYVFKGDSIFQSILTEEGWICQIRVEHAHQHSALYTSQAVSEDVWHKRLCHTPVNRLQEVARAVDGLNVTRSSSRPQGCVGCIRGKLPARAHPGSTLPRSRSPLDVVHLDSIVINIEGAEGEKYCHILTDDFSRARFVFPTRTKGGGEWVEIFDEWLTWAERTSGKTLKCIRSDNAKEYVSGQFATRLKKLGVEIQTSIPYEHQSNGTAERSNRVILDRARTILLDSNLGKEYWPDATRTAGFVGNRIPGKELATTPIELFGSRRPSVGNLRVFGSEGMVHLPRDKLTGSNKLDSRTMPARMLGYANHGSAYRMLMDGGEVIVSSDVIFMEEKREKNISKKLQLGGGVETIGTSKKFSNQEFTSSKKEITNSHQNANSRDDTTLSRRKPMASMGIDHLSKIYTEDDGMVDEEDTYQIDHSSQWDKGENVDGNNDGGKARIRMRDGQYLAPVVQAGGSRGSGETEAVEMSSSGSATEEESFEDASSFPRSHSVNRSPHGSYQSYTEEVHTTPARKSTRVSRPLKEWWVAERAPTHMAWLTQAQLRRNPTLHAKFQQAMEDELKNMQDYDAWDLCQLPRGRGIKPLKSIWVHSIKKKDGKETPKSRLVANGSQQRYGIDYTESFSPVAKPTSIRTIFVMALQDDARIHQSDVVAAYLNGNLEEGEEVWMTQPEGFEVHGRDGRMLHCRLKKAIYGLKQAGRRWNEHLNRFMKVLGFTRSIWDQCVYFRGTGKERLVVAVVVDDLITIYQDRDTFKKFWERLAQEFKVKDLGEVEHYVGIKVERDWKAGTLDMGQTQLIDEVLEAHQMNDAKPRNTPMTAGEVLKPATDDEVLTDQPYQTLVGQMMYPMVWTRPDLAFAVGSLGQHAHKPTEEHWNAGMDVMKYIKRTRDVTLRYKQVPPDECQLTIYADSDWAGDLHTGRSVWGYVVFLGGCCISWKSKKCRAVATSSTVAEMEGLYNATMESIWIRELWKELTGKDLAPVTIYQDNDAVIALVNGDKSISRAKQETVKIHYLRQQILEGSIRVERRSTDKMVADVLSKSLGRTKHWEHVRKMGIQLNQA